MTKTMELDVEDLGVASIETRGAPSGVTEPGGLIKQAGISDAD